MIADACPEGRVEAIGDAWRRSMLSVSVEDPTHRPGGAGAVGDRGMRRRRRAGSVAGRRAVDGEEQAGSGAAAGAQDFFEAAG